MKYGNDYERGIDIRKDMEETYERLLNGEELTKQEMADKIILWINKTDLNDMNLHGMLREECRK